MVVVEDLRRHWSQVKISTTGVLTMRIHNKAGEGGEGTPDHQKKIVGACHWSPLEHEKKVHGSSLEHEKKARSRSTLVMSVGAR